MQKFYSFILFCTLICVLMSVTSCSSVSFDAKNAGIVAGTAIYFAYEKVAEKQDDEFREKVSDLWEKVNEIESIEQLNEQLDDLTARFEEITNNDKIPEKLKPTVTNLHDIVIGKVNKLRDSVLTPDSTTLSYFVGIREGINNMIAMKKEEVE